MAKQITEEYIRCAIDYIHTIDKDFPQGGINYFFTDAEFSSCDIPNLAIEYKINVPIAAVNRIGVAHGGYQAGLFDELMGWTLYILRANKGFICTTSSISFDYIKPIEIGSEITAKIQVLHLGRRSAVTTGSLYQNGKLCTVAKENWTVLNSGAEPDALEPDAPKSASGNSGNDDLDPSVILETLHYRGTANIK